MKRLFDTLFALLIVAIGASCANFTLRPVKEIIKPGDWIGAMTIER